MMPGLAVRRPLTYPQDSQGLAKENDDAEDISLGGGGWLVVPDSRSRGKTLARGTSEQ
jgi:hypothetical protein